MMKTKKTMIAALLAAAAGPLFAQVIQLKFEGLTVPDPADATKRLDVRVDDFYNGGTVKPLAGGTFDPAPAPGPNFHVKVTPGANSDVRGLEASGAGGSGNFAASGAIGGTGVLGLISGETLIELVDNVIFNEKMAFYVSALGSNPLVVTVNYANGNTFTPLLPSALGSCQSVANCLWVEVPLVDLGLNIKSVSFRGNEVLLDNITLGSASAANLTDQNGGGSVPEPGTYALMACGLAAAGLTSRRRKTLN